jgi:hypothetical protein
VGGDRQAREALRSRGRVDRPQQGSYDRARRTRASDGQPQRVREAGEIGHRSPIPARRRAGSSTRLLSLRRRHLAECATNSRDSARPSAIGSRSGGGSRTEWQRLLSDRRAAAAVSTTPPEGRETLRRSPTRYSCSGRAEEIPVCPVAVGGPLASRMCMENDLVAPCWQRSRRSPASR